MHGYTAIELVCLGLCWVVALDPTGVSSQQPRVCLPSLCFLCFFFFLQ